MCHYYYYYFCHIIYNQINLSCCLSSEEETEWGKGEAQKGKPKE